MPRALPVAAPEMDGMRWIRSPSVETPEFWIAVVSSTKTGAAVSVSTRRMREPVTVTV